jgi:hypothetical protein
LGSPFLSIKEYAWKMQAKNAWRKTIMNKIVKEVQESLKNLKRVKPLVHCITNYVTVNDCANAILSIGGSPAMADAIEEVRKWQPRHKLCFKY